MQESLFVPQHSGWGQTKTEKMGVHSPPSATCRSAKDQERPSGSENAEDTAKEAGTSVKTACVNHAVQHKAICLMAWT